MSKVLTPGMAVKQLKEQVFRFDENSASHKLDLIKRCSELKQLSTPQILNLHKSLLCLLAYPENESVYQASVNCLSQLYSLVKELGSEKKTELQQSTLPYTVTRGFYSFSLVQWLIRQESAVLNLDELETSAVHPREVLRHSLSEMEYELHGNEALKPMEWLQFACGSRDKKVILDFVLTQLGNLSVSTTVKDQLFEAMRIGIRFQSKESRLSAGHLKTEFGATFFHGQGLLKNFDENALIGNRLPEQTQLKVKEKEQLIHTARCCLFLLNRETDPVTLCDENGIEFYELERGFSIAFFSKQSERRLPLESYIGFMMFKNRYPLAYGGAWLFGKRSLLGINIFEAYRGGESAYLFCQLLRSYKQRFRLTYVEVEPYQFGRGNPEGIKSGAFWFYYRFGFRPSDAALKKLAEQEYKKIKSSKGYRSPVAVLKAFTESNMVWNPFPDQKVLDPGIISHYITLQINEKFSGNRANFKVWCLNILKNNLGIEPGKMAKDGRTGCEKLYAFVALCLNTDQLTKKEKAQLAELIIEKGKSEFRYAELLEEFDLIKHIGPTELREELGI